MVTLLAMPIFAEWQVIPSPQAEPDDYRAVSITPNGTVHIFGRYGFYARGNETGFDVRPQMDNYGGYTKNSQFLDNSIGYISGGAIVKTTDGGDSWSNLTFPTPYNVVNIEFVNPDTGFGVGDYEDSGLILFTNDGGANFTQLTSPTDDTIDDIAVKKDGDDLIVIIMAAYQIFKTTDMGQNWEDITPAHESLFTNLEYCEHGDYWFLVGLGNFIVKSTDNGLNWIQSDVPNSTAIITSLSLCYSGETVIIGCNDGTVEVSTDAGNTFTITETSFSNGISNMSSYNNETWGVGLSGFIVYNPNTPVSINSNYEKPSIFQLKQNYPNPFNPSTQIEYSLPANDFVNFTIYNAIGQVVDVVSSEYHIAGNYEILWNGSELPSGMYFYQIKTSTFTNGKSEENRNAVRNFPESVSEVLRIFHISQISV